MTNDIEPVLNLYSSAVLSQISNIYPEFKPGNKKKAYQVEYLSQLFTSQVHIEKTMAQLPAAALEVIHILQRHGGFFPTLSIQHRLLYKKMIDKDADNSNRSTHPNPRKPDSRRFLDLMAHLTTCGLVFSAAAVKEPFYENLDFSRQAGYAIPDVILKQLPAPPPEEKTQYPIIAPVGTPLKGSMPIFQRNLFLYWGAVRQNPVNLTMKGLVSKRHFATINNHLVSREIIEKTNSEEDYPRLWFLRVMAQHLNLLVNDQNILFANSEQAQSFFALDILARTQLCLSAYIQCNAFNEVFFNPAAYKPTSDNPYLPAPQTVLNARGFIFDAVSYAQDWCRISDVVNYLRAHYYEFLMPRTASYYYYRQNIYSSENNIFKWGFSGIHNEEEGWNIVEKKFIEFVIQGPLYWLGLVNLGTADKELTQPDLFQLTEAGKWLFAHAPQPEISTPTSQVVTQPDFTMMALDPASEQVLMSLEQFGQRVTSDRITQYKLTRESVYDGQLNGWHADQIIAFLEKQGQQKIPANVVRTLQEWQNSHERIRIYPNATLIHFNHSSDLQKLKEQSKITEQLSNNPTPTTAIVKEDSIPLYLSLLQLGFIPLLRLVDDPIPSHSVTLDENGLLTFRQETHDIYLVSYLARFSDPEGEKAFRITPASIRRAVGSGLTADMVLFELERVVTGPITPLFKQRLLAWSGHFGSVVAEEVLSLKFKDKQTLEALISDPDLQKYLGKLSASNLETTAFIRLKDREKVFKILAERGVEIK